MNELLVLPLVESADSKMDLAGAVKSRTRPGGPGAAGIERRGGGVGRSASMGRSRAAMAKDSRWPLLELEAGTR